MAQKPPSKIDEFLAAQGHPPRKVMGVDLSAKAVHPQRQPTHVGLAPPAPGSAPVPSLGATQASREAAKPVPHAPGEAPPKSLSPPPRSYPTSAAEREAAGLRADLRQALDELAAERARRRAESVEVDVSETPTSLRRTIALDVKSWTAVFVAFVAIVIGGWAKYDASRAAPEKVEAHTTLIADETKKGDVMADRIRAIIEYERDRDAAQECRNRQTASMAERTNGYRLGFSSENVEWQSVCLNQPGKVCRGPLYQAKPCPDMPELPQR